MLQYKQLVQKGKKYLNKFNLDETVETVMENSIPSVSIIVLNYNGKHYLERCFSSLKLTDYPISKFDVIMADNGSSDGSIQYVQKEFPWVKTVALGSNFGFGGGNNRAIKYAKGKYIAFLNNDTEVTRNWLMALIKAATTYSVPICSSKTLFMDNQALIEYGGGKFTVNGRGYSIAFGKDDNNKTECSFTGYPCAASMLIKTEVFKKLDGFDEDYFACLDDTDLGWRAWLLGYETLFCPTSIVHHVAGGTAGKGRLSPIKALYGTKGPIITVLKNLELKNLPAGLLLVSAYDLNEIILLLKNRNWSCLRMKFKAYPWIIAHFSDILRKRRSIQKTRVVSDNWLAAKTFLVSFSEAFKEYRRLNKLN
jgi:GT2 family glycosyltransferase